MLLLQQACEVRDSVIEYIKATFRYKEKGVSDVFYRFIEDKQNGLFKGPYVSLKNEALFTKCDRIADYRRAWAHFDKIFKNKEK